MNLSLKGNRAMVCGSSDGLGMAAALILARRGAELILIARNRKKLEKVKLALSTANNQKHKIICADFNYPEKLEVIIDNYLSLTDKKINILVNNSGGPPGGDIIQATQDEFRLAFERLLICNQIMVRRLVPNMKLLGRGKIINIISMSVRQVIGGLGVSNTIRGGVAQWAKTLALEIGKYGITVNNLLPGYTYTKRLQELVNNKAKITNTGEDEIIKNWESSISLQRLGRPDEIGNAIAFLASEASDYINGFDFCVDGGWIGR